MTLEATAPDRPDTMSEASMPTPALIAHILERYHQTHRRELPELIELARKVERVHRRHPQAPLGMGDLLALIADDLEMHQQKEEQILFPMMLNAAGPMVHHPIARMMIEHEDVEAQLAVLDEMSDGLTPPANACGSWRRLYEGCRKFREDLRAHIRIEDTVLFPRFLD
ncbi:MAG TPA: hemerythrin domain-containing protein [Brevundimonas sp.]|uniref:hemerythrin domain-containing protein n=1 Tax=Brevundimonas sp. TaxID=1871086 RepID=UPI0026074F1B|nr:hemerythrin domain-containing protein [Brevundimonas sp.]HRO32109.1 hemerythrin domain-containing protein [Brevundimonas sp.]